MPVFGRPKNGHLLEFYGIECDHCVDMEPVIEQLKHETGLTMRRFEVWYNDDNLRLLQRLDTNGRCGGVPFFYNKKTQYWICGATTYANFKNWAEDKPAERFLPPPKEGEEEEETSSLGKAKSFIERIRKEGMERMQSRMESGSGGPADKGEARDGPGAFVRPQSQNLFQRAMLGLPGRKSHTSAIGPARRTAPRASAALICATSAL
ncbi:hypothetical protein FVE85_3998 [Porphyridium purpureum]|uniref:Thioredoxin domain-containing protein n=1 Tax=Porphyridium purpureum TaxID=35688 RepID=A0A5J4YT87_PORPP|nr:hypothetical protein FVE85_3998 [Porphyridium purpureum]|eukprot:POR0993..scf229_5